MRRRERGSVFILTLAVTVGLLAVLASVVATQRLNIRAQINRTETARARLAAESAIQRAMATLSVMSLSEPTTLDGEWATLGNKGADRFVVGSSSFRMQILDASARININTVPEDQLRRLPLTDEQIDSLLDWREGSTGERAMGAKDTYYNSLAEPYNAKLSRFDSVDELLMVRGFTGRRLFFPQTDVVSTAVTLQGSNEELPPLSEIFVVDSYSDQNNTEGQTKLNVNAGGVTAQQIAQRLNVQIPVAQSIVQGRPYARLGDVLTRPGMTPDAQRRALDNLTINGAPRVEGRINLNTADEYVLLSAPGITGDVAKAIVARQAAGFTALSEMMDVPGLSTLAVLVAVADLFTVRSQSFIVRSIGQAGDAAVALEALVVIENEQPRLLRITESPFADPRVRWGWEETTSNEIVLQEAP